MTTMEDPKGKHHAWLVAARFTLLIVNWAGCRWQVVFRLIRPKTRPEYGEEHALFCEDVIIFVITFGGYRDDQSQNSQSR